jgi:hypothetical protein
MDNKYKGIYAGIHSTNNIDDNYLGSGIHIKQLKKTYGYKNFIKFNIKFFENRQQALEYEKKIVNKEWIKSEYTLNKVIGGKGSINNNNQQYTPQQKIEILEKNLQKALKIYNSNLD